ncbi:MAG: sulfatase family protein [Planctomycetota bacterium]|jgi:arylsulfatase A
MTRQFCTRRQFCKALGLGLVGLRLSGCASPDRRRASDKPNFIIIFCDDMGYADIGPFGARGYSTPNLDRMAAEGMVFTDFHVGRSVCSPSRAAIMTGCYPNRVGVPTNFGPSSKNGMNPDAVTVAQLVKQKGYATAIYGKWHLGHLPEYLPTSRGFDEWFGLPYSNDMWPYHPDKRYNFPDLPLMEGTKVLNPAVQPEDQQNLTTWYTERTVKFINKNKNRPFLIYLPHAMPHVPLYVSDKFKDKTKRGVFGDVIKEIDWGVGKIIEALKKNGIDENTLVIFTSDNGPWLLYGDHAGSAYPLREGKATSFEGGFRVPCVMRWPGRIPKGKRCDELTATIDVLPTIAALARAKLSEKVDGKDISPLMFGRSGAKSPHDVYYYFAGYNLQAIRSGKWKLVFPHKYSIPEPAGMGGQHGKRGLREIGLSLFDLSRDIAETTDVKDKYPEVVERLEELAVAARTELGKKPG